MSEHVRFTYTNYKGETRDRLVRPVNLFFGKTEWHSEPQWLMTAFDLDKGEYRDFAMKDIDNWRPA